jgi:iron complex transport system ATP-binding protein
VVTLRGEALVCDYPGPLRAVDGVELELRGGELVALIGPNGSGKSTLLRALAGLRPCTSGRVVVDGADIARWSAAQRALSIAVVPQFLPTLADVRVDDFVLGGRYAHVDRWRGPTRADADAVKAALVACDAADHGERVMSELSGGQRQRVVIARAIAQQAEILLVDEPTSSLDPEHQVRVFELLGDLAARGRAVLVVTHELNLAAQFAGRVVVLDRARIAASGSVEEMLRREVLAPVYGERLYYGRTEGPEARPFVVPWAGGGRITER